MRISKQALKAASLALLCAVVLLGCSNPAGPSSPAGPEDAAGADPADDTPADDGQLEIGLSSDFPESPTVTLSGVPIQVSRGTQVQVSSNGYDNYTWYIEGSSSHPALSASTGETVSIDTDQLSLGPHNVTVAVSDENGTYSSSAILEVKE